MNRHIVHIFTPLLVCALSSIGAAQSFNLDYGEDPGHPITTPANTYGAAASQPGFWNPISDGQPGSAIPPSNFVPWCVATLKDLSGNLTSVTTTATVSANTNSIGDWWFNNAGTTGNDDALLDDFCDAGNGGIVPAPFIDVTYSGLAPGTYDVYTYAWAPDSAGFITSVSADNSLTTNPRTSGGPWTGVHVEGITYTLHTVSVCAGTIRIVATTASGAGTFGSINGVQLKLVAPGSCFAPFCFGDGTQTQPCPCANNGAPGKGCNNSANTGGASIAISGTTNPDTIVITSSGELPTALSIFLSGDIQLNGVPFGDGVRCVGGQLKRLYTKNASGGVVSAPGGGDPSVSQQHANLGDPLSPGAFRIYQVYYRDPNLAFCAPPQGNSWNVSTAAGITW